ncbi:4438_t:CDS:2, partial [Racocetra persica]
KLIIFNDTIYEITMWNIDKLSIRTRILIDWEFIPESIKISDDEELLLVLKTETAIERFYLIASGKGERILFTTDDECVLVDPYELGNLRGRGNLIDASELLIRNKVQIQKPYMIQSDGISDKIIYTVDGKVLIEELVPDKKWIDNWVGYLRKELEDNNRITTP